MIAPSWLHLSSYQVHINQSKSTINTIEKAHFVRKPLTSKPYKLRIIPEMEEEIEVLKAIYENDLTVIDEPGLPLRLECKIGLSDVVEFTLPAGYPSAAPNVKLKMSSASEREMVEGLIVQSFQSKEDNYLYDAIAIARNWSLHNEVQPENHDQKSNKKSTVCRFFLEGKCKFGDKCFNKHPGSDSRNDVKVQNKNNGLTVAERSSIDNKVTEETKDHVSEKKIAMKTAVDVISRILWDEELPTELFTVGYLDRFLGIIEKPFSSFSWEDIASVDYSVLAIPKHRIQYFKYRDVIIWDKRTRLDKVFGSTGDGKQIYEIIKEYSVSEDGNTYSEKEDCVSTEESFSHEDSTNSEDDFDDDDNADGDSEQGQVAVYRSRSEKDRPNFFFCFRITKHSIKEKILEVQGEIVSCNSLLQDSCLKQSDFHVTLCMVRLQNEDEKHNALRVLDSLQPLLVCLLPSFKQLLFQKLGNFHGRVLHVKVEEDGTLSKFVNILLLKLKDAGLHACGNREPYCPHITIMKLSRPTCRMLSLQQIDPNYYQHRMKSVFGKASVEEIFLCSTSKLRDEGGFYVKLGSKVNSLLCISDHLSNAIASHVNCLTENSFFTEQEGDELVQAVLSNDEVQFEKAVCYIQRALNRRLDLSLQRGDVFIMRGLQGSGKSHLVNSCTERLAFDDDVISPRKCSGGNEIVICSADEYFDDKTTGYSFNPSELASAHIQCQKKFVDAICNGVRTIVVDNTNSNAWEYRIYERIAKLCGYSSHVIEIACRNEETLKKFIDRSQHNVDYDSVLKMWKRWEPDEIAVILEPRFGEGDEKVSFLELCNRNQPPASAKGVLFSAFFLDSDSKQRLFEEYPPLHSKVTGNHMTLAYKPRKEELAHIPVGKQHKVEVTGHICSDLMQAVAVKELGDACCTIEIPHITVSHSKKTAPQHAKMALANKSAWRTPEKKLNLSGTIGVQVDVGLKNSVIVTNPVRFDEFCKQIMQVNNDHIEKEIKVESVRNKKDKQSFVKCDEIPEIFSGPAIIDSLFVFDFDGTLFETPDPVEGRKLYQQLTGEKWPHTSWIGRPESLQWPLRSYPGPSFVDFKEHIGRAGSLTILLTGRLERTVEGVHEVLQEYGAWPERCYLKPDDALNKPSKAMAKVASFKTDVLKGLLKEYPTIKNVKIWDDRQDNIDAFKRLRKEHNNISFEIYHVGKINKPLKEQLSRDMQKMVLDFGFGTSRGSDTAANCGTEFIMDAWYTCVKTRHGVDDAYLRLFGSFPLKRQSDIDMCILAPNFLKQDECVLKLEAELSKRGVRYVHSAIGIKCPRLKVRLLFKNATPADFDIVFAPCLSAVNEAPTSLKELYINGKDELKRSLEGVIFLERVESCIDGKISKQVFGRLVDLIVHYLKSKHLKGNAFHCVRTFHIVRALAEMFSKSSSSCNELSDFLKMSFEYMCSLGIDYWCRICKDTVPREFIEKTMDSFVTAVALLNQSTSCATLFAISEFPPSNHSAISLTVKSHVPELQWRAYTVVEAKLGGYLRKLMATGIDIQPGPCDGRSVLMFAALQTERTCKALHSVLLGLKAEPVFLHNRNDLDLILKIRDQNSKDSATF